MLPRDDNAHLEGQERAQASAHHAEKDVTGH